MPSSVAGLVAIGVLRRISWGGADDAALRTQHSFTLGERLSALTTTVDRWKTKMQGDLKAEPPVLPIVPPIGLFDRSSSDLSNLVGLKAVASVLLEKSAIPSVEASELFDDKRSKYRDIMARRFFPDGGLPPCSSKSELLQCNILQRHACRGSSLVRAHAGTGARRRRHGASRRGDFIVRPDCCECEQ